MTFAGAFVAFVSSLFLIIHWSEDRSAQSAIWWAGAHCLSGVGLALLAMRADFPPYVSVIALRCLDLSTILTCVAALSFGHESVKLRIALAASIAWLGTSALVRLLAGESYAIAWTVGIAGCLYAAMAFEFWRGRGEVLRGRVPMICVISLEALALMMAAVGYGVSSNPATNPAFSWLGIIHFVRLIYIPGSTIFLVSMLRDRTETKHKTAAFTDPLTGLPNRRAFEDWANKLLDSDLRSGLPTALLAFDLDKFKLINDTYGHAIGDKVLIIFASVLAESVRNSDVIGRLGGEEFAAALSGVGSAEVVAISDRIRALFQESAQVVDEHRIGATVSVGVATTDVHPCGLGDIAEHADEALYQAKRRGRNQVVVAATDYTRPKGLRIARAF
jgi:diguanylate cyclase (GGDEF)-like protein